MRITLVADNITAPNWGCRATSLALREILSRKHEIVATVTRALLSAPVTTSSILPANAHWTLVRRFRRKRLQQIPVLGPLATGVIDLAGHLYPPSHAIEKDADIMWRTRDSSPKSRQIVEKLEACDAVVVNGEGEMIFSTPARDTLLQTLAICALAKKMDRRIFYINGMISKAPVGEVNLATARAAAETLGQALFAVRDHQSVEVAAELMPGIRPVFFADALFGWRRHFGEDALSRHDAARIQSMFDRTGTEMPGVLQAPYVAISGSSQAAKNPGSATRSYTALANALKGLGVPLLLVATCSGDRFLAEVAKRTGLPFLPVDTPIMAGAAVMANARLLVSGRWHPSIMASLGGTPCVFLGSNSHKTLSLQYLLDYPEKVEYAAIPGEDDIAGIVGRSRRLLAEGNSVRASIAAAAARMEESARGLAEFVS